MDLSAIIFVVLALAWAVYLIPKALQHHDEVASDRLVEGHTDKVRILARRNRVTDQPEVVEVEVEVVERTSVAAPAEQTSVPRPLPTRATARRAAQRRRRVLGVLLVGLAVVVGFAVFAVLPWWSVAVPAGLVVAFLVVARLSVRAAERGRASVAAPVTGATAPAATAPAVEHTNLAHARDTASHLVEQLTESGSADERRQVEELLAEDGSLWDPLPMTLPTYVNKARARRTVRTIELTGINSSGHDDADTALARQSEEPAAAESTGAEAGRAAGM